MCGQNDHPPYDQPLYQGPRCDSCGGDHFADASVLVRAERPSTQEAEAAAHEALVRQEVFRDLDPEQERRFRAWARENYTPGERISPMWHPVIRAEAEAMNEGCRDCGDAVDVRDPDGTPFCGACHHARGGE